jgi:uncharacterized protein (TIGR02145 family)
MTRFIFFTRFCNSRITIRKKMISLFPFLITFMFLMTFLSCKETSTEPQNRLPKIESLTANPAAVLINTETTLTCIATDEDGDNLTITWSSKRGTFSNGNVGVSVKWIAPLTAGRDTIYIIVNDGKQLTNGKLEIVVGTISASPTLLTPNHNSTEVSLSPTLIWNPVNDAVSYTLQVSTNNSFSSFIFNQSGFTNTNQQINGLNSNTTYYWRISATNIYGTSSWSSVFSFKTLAPPQAPTLLTPLNNAYGISTSPTLTWNTVGNAVSYTLQVSTDNSFGNYVFNQSGITKTNQQIYVSERTTYYWRVSATNNLGTSIYSVDWTFKTYNPCIESPSVVYGGKTYNTVQVGMQCWLKENLDIGTRISGNSNQTNNNTIEKYCYNDDNANCTTYGGLYQWAEAVQYKSGATNSSSPNPLFIGNVQGICPDGWHIPKLIELQTLSSTIINDGNALKANGQGTGNGVGTNTSGFSALIAGTRGNNSIYGSLGVNTNFWSSTESNATSAHYLTLNYSYSAVLFSYANKDFGFSIRCIKD